MAERNRLRTGGRIDRTRAIEFTFDNRRFSGFSGDTLASALLANDIHLIGRSFKYHRPRGILSAGVEEPNALVQVGEGESTEPNVRATQLELHPGLAASSQNRWPSLAFDLGGINDRLSALLPAGFYYKTFMWPRSAWLKYEHFIRRMAGLGRAPDARDPDRYERMHAHCDVLVVGAGPAGIAAALAAGRSGARVMLVDDQPEPGGTLLGERYEIDGRPATAWVGVALAELRSLPRVRVLERTTITGYYDHNFLVGFQRLDAGSHQQSGAPRQRLWKVRAGEVVIATGAIERPLVFPDNDRPAIMLAQAVRVYLHRYGVRAGTRVVLVTCHDDAYRTALSLADAGASVNAVVDMRARADGFLPKQVRARGIDVIAGATVTGTSGRMRVSSVQVASLDGKGDIRELECDLVAMSGGFTPSVHLFSQSRGSLRYDETLGSYRPDAARQPARCAGAANGTLPLRAVLQEGFAAGADAAQSAGFASAGPNAVPETTDPEAHSGGFHLGYGRATAAHRKSFVDFQSDVTIADLRLAHREGYALPEHLKRYTTAGMGVDQGKTGNVNGLAILAELSGGSIAELAATTFRPPYVPLGFGAIAGADRGELFDPVRITPMHAWHERCGAVFEDVGQWKRPWYYPRGGETMRQAVDRECLAVRRDVGMLDASTLGKIDIQGEDALEFLERVYCNGFRSLAIGRCRYGVMLRQDGMVFDDGVTARLGERHFLMTTTTGGAARVLAWLEEWLQTEWPTLKVYCTSVTEQYAQIAVSGPRSADLVSPLTSVKLDAMPFMSVREGEVAGIAARIFRISFSGALGYEIAVPASRAYELWTTLIGAGERFGITPYGTEAMHVLRAEKGFIIAGQDTDGSVTPIDLGMDRMVAMGKDFIGKRSLARADLVRRDRKQLVGLLTDDPDAVLPEGVHVVEEVTPPPMPMLGHVTSSYYSAVLRRSIALALIRGGVARIGGELHAMVDGVAVKVNVVAPRFLNDSNEAING